MRLNEFEMYELILAQVLYTENVFVQENYWTM